VTVRLAVAAVIAAHARLDEARTILIVSARDRVAEEAWMSRERSWPLHGGWDPESGWVGETLRHDIPHDGSQLVVRHGVSDCVVSVLSFESEELTTDNS
jgi:hypothetical protein